jgi:RimJ/RimL family protein N-acetyltransferase
MSFDGPLPPTPVLETERLILRPVEPKDASAIQREFPHWEVVKYLHAGIPWPYPDDGAETNMRDCLERMAKGQILVWTLTLKGGDDELIGRIDLKANVQDLDMRGFWLARAYWGRGLMMEAAERVTAFAFEDLGWPFLILNNAAENRASHRIKEKQGATLVGRLPHRYMCGEMERENWILTREAWRARLRPDRRLER